MHRLRVVMNGDRLDIRASVDLEGLKMMQKMQSKQRKRPPTEAALLLFGMQCQLLGFVLPD